MSNNPLLFFLQHKLYEYNRPKVNLLKSILPILIIIHHIDHQGFTGVELIEATGDIVMFFSLQCLVMVL